MFIRKINTFLKDWSESSYRKPLLIMGARQVGKTTAIRMFSQNFDVYIELNLELEADRDLFAKESDVKRLYNLILLAKRIGNSDGKVLLFIDEIQYSAAAIASLRYFYELMPELYVIAAGSLLEVYLNKSRIGMPVGRISSVWMLPLDFEEFLEAAGQDALLASLREIPFQNYLLPVLRQWFRQYALIGGMPEVVKIYLETNDISKVRSIQIDLLSAYDDDMVKYAQTKEQADIIRFVWKHLPLEVCKQVSFSGFGSSEFRTEPIRSALRMLELCGLINLIYPYTTYELPALENTSKRPKLLMLDTGLLNYLANVQMEYFGTSDLNSIYKGIAMEHLIGQALISIGSDSLHPLGYWVRAKTGSSAEIDYLFRYGTKLIPLEVKAGKSGTLRSLRVFMEDCPHNLAIRIYDGDLVIQELSRQNGTKYTLLNLPLPLISRLPEFVNSWFSPQGLTFSR